jgi:hypothetical protein
MKRPEGRKRRLKPWPHEADRLRQQSYEAADEAYKLIDAARKAYLARTDASTELRKALTYVVRNPRLAEAMIERAITLIDEKTHDLEPGPDLPMDDRGCHPRSQTTHRD